MKTIALIIISVTLASCAGYPFSFSVTGDHGSIIGSDEGVRIDYRPTK